MALLVLNFDKLQSGALIQWQGEKKPSLVVERAILPILLVICVCPPFALNVQNNVLARHRFHLGLEYAY